MASGVEAYRGSILMRHNCNKMLSYRRETALQGALQFSPKVEDWNWETIFYGHYRSIFNHCDIIGLKILGSLETILLLRKLG